MSFEISKVQEKILSEVLAKMEPFKYLDPVDIRRLVLSAERLQVKKGSHIFEPGDVPKSIFVLLEGAVKVSTPNYGYKEVIHELVNSPAIFGLSNCCVEGSIKNIATSLSHNSTVYAVPFVLLKEFLQHNNLFTMKLFTYLSERIKEKEGRVEQLMLKDARERVVGFLRRNALEKGVRIGFEMLLRHNFTQQDIADFTGTSRQTVTNILKDLKERNIIKVERRSILIRDITKFK